MGLPHSTKEYRFNDTNLDGTVRHAFQALALDEHRNPFSPAVWERMDMRKCTVDLRQVWFPGAHSNVGGGYDDQEIANISLAWMMDQLASIGVAFQSDYIDRIFADSVRYYYNPRKLPARVSNIFARPVTKQWAIEPVFEKHKPVRPWGLGEIYESEIGFVWIFPSFPSNFATTDGQFIVQNHGQTNPHSRNELPCRSSNWFTNG